MNSRRCLLALLLTAAIAPRANAAQVTSDDLGLVPAPQSVTLSEGTFTLPHRWSIEAHSQPERDAAAFAAAYAKSAGYQASLVDRNAALRLRGSVEPAMPEEGYRLRIDASGVEIGASSGAGLYYGLATFEQLIEARGATLPFVDVVDAPRFRWRGIHLDVSRHFFGVPVVERYIDIASHYKLNTFHWHLTDDQGWRIQIRRYPLLTTTGACRLQTEVGNDATEFDGRRYCGFYTQRQIREVVAYANRRHVTIVPEIEMPGHADASVAAYPWLACGSPHVNVRETWGVSHVIYCPTEASFRFLDNVLSEVVRLFPGKYVHVGGDEVPKDEWERSSFVHALMRERHLATYDAVQGYFDRRVEAMLERYGRRMIGWDEILDGGVSNAATIMSWRGEAGGIKAAKRGNDVVMTPDGPLYFDAYQGDANDEPQAIDDFTRLQDVYDYGVIPALLNPTAASHIIGVQGNLWTEYIPSESQVFYMLLPRAAALAELAWSPQSTRSWTSFERRMAPQYAWMVRNGINFRIPNPTFAIHGANDLTFDNVAPSVRTVSMRAGQTVTVAITDPDPSCSVYYTTDGTMPSTKSARYVAPVELDPKPGERSHIVAVCVLANGRRSTPSKIVVSR